MSNDTRFEMNPEIETKNSIKTESHRKEHWSSEIIRILKSKWAIRVGLVALALIFLRIAVNYFLEESVTEAAPYVHIAPATVQTLDLVLTLPGNIEALEQASIYAHVGGYLKKVYVDEGKRVGKGQLMAEIDAPDIENEYSKLKAAYEFQGVTRNRYKALLDDSVISQQEYDAVDSAYAEARARFQGASAELDYTKIRAPFAGSVARRLKLPGDLITVGKAGEAPIFLLVNESKLRIVMNVSQSDLSNIRIGIPADIHIDTFPDKVFSGKVTGLDDLLDANSKTQRVLIDIDNTDGLLHAGMFATVSIHFQHKDNALLVPAEAINQEEKDQYVFKYQDGKAKKTIVTTGLKDSGRTEILSGLAPGDLVILRGTQALSDGDKVQNLDAKN